MGPQTGGVSDLHEAMEYPVTLRLVVEITNPDEPNRMLWSERLAEAIEAAGLPCGYFTITEPSAP